MNEKDIAQLITAQVSTSWLTNTGEHARWIQSCFNRGQQEMLRLHD